MIKSGHFFANYMLIFHKTEIQTVILRYFTSLNLNWYKSYDKKHKNIKNKKDANICFCTKSQKKKEMEIFAFCIIKGIRNLKYLLPSDEGILQFLSSTNEIWSRDQFFHENQLCFYAGVSFGVK